MVGAGARSARQDADEGLELEPAREAPAPAKLTRSSGEPWKPAAPAKRTATESAVDERANTEEALAYARWLLGPERGWQPVQRRAEMDASPDHGALASAFSYLAEAAPCARALPEALARKLTESFGIDAARIRIHTDDRAASAAALVRARAFTLGADIYFAAGAYAPESEDGVELIAHEVAHVAQHLRGQARLGSEAVSRPGDAHEIEADELARRFLAAQRRPPPERRDGFDVRGPNDADSTSWWGAPVRRQSAPLPAAPLPLDLTVPISRKPAAPGTAGALKRAAAALPVVVDLLGKPDFEPTPEVAAHIEKAGASGADVRVRLGSLSPVSIVRVKKSGRRYVTVEDAPQVVPLSHALFVPAPGLSPVVRVRIGAGGSGSAITGYLAPASSPGSTSALARSITADPSALGLRGFELPHAALENTLSGGTLAFGTKKPTRFELGGWVSGDLAFGLVNQAVTFEAAANLHARGLRDAELRLSRDGRGQIQGSARLAVDLGDKFTGSATATYRDGDVAISGELAYASEKFRGKLGLMVADVAAAEQMVRAQLDPLGVQPIAGVGGAGGAKPAPIKGKKGERGIAGWGALDFAFTDWLVGRAQVVYGPTGHLTVVGKIAPPQRLDLMKSPKGVKKPIVPEARIEASYGLPYIADVHVGIGVSLSANAELGPIYMTDLGIEGVYSTDPSVMNAFSITGALRAQAQAGLSLDVKGYAGLRILKHSVNFGAAIKGDAGIKAYAEARPTLGYREVASPSAGKQGEYYLKGHLEMAAQPVLALGGRLFVELDSPWWSPAPDKTWEWPLGKLEYPLPTQLGVGADIDYVVGSGQWPELKLTQPSFSPGKFVDTLMDDKLPSKSGRSGTQQKPGQWQGVAPAKPTAAPPSVAKKPVAEPKADTGGASAKQKKGKQTPDEKKNVPKSQDAAARWNAGMEALGELRKRSEQDPETQSEIQQHLAELKARHGFTKLSADRAGDLWLVDAAMNPEKKDIPIKADPKEKPGDESKDSVVVSGDMKGTPQRLTLDLKKGEVLLSNPVDAALQQVAAALSKVRAMQAPEDRKKEAGEALGKIKWQLELLLGMVKRRAGNTTPQPDPQGTSLMKSKADHVMAELAAYGVKYNVHSLVELPVFDAAEDYRKLAEQEGGKRMDAAIGAWEQQVSGSHYREGTTEIWSGWKVSNVPAVKAPAVTSLAKAAMNAKADGAEKMRKLFTADGDAKREFHTAGGTVAAQQALADGTAKAAKDETRQAISKTAYVPGGDYGKIETPKGTPSADPKLQQAVVAAGGIIAFMKGMATAKAAGGMTHAELVAALGEQANLEHLKKLFRAADPGKHEWIPSNQIPDVINRAHSALDLETAAAWVDLHHELRADTRHLIFAPAYATGTKTISGKTETVLCGHSGALYIKIGNTFEPSTYNQNIWHDELRKAFDGSTSIVGCIDALRAKFKATIWNGKDPLPHGIYEGYTDASGVPLAWASLAATQAGNFQAVDAVLAKCRAAFARFG